MAYIRGFRKIGEGGTCLGGPHTKDYKMILSKLAPLFGETSVIGGEAFLKRVLNPNDKFDSLAPASFLNPRRVAD